MSWTRTRIIAEAARLADVHPPAAAAALPPLAVLYDGLCGLHPWAELGCSVTVAHTLRARPTYPWPTEGAPARLMSLTIQDPRDGHWARALTPAAHASFWERAGQEWCGMPRYYRVTPADEAALLTLRPAPAWSGLLLQLHGLRHPQPLATPAAHTVFNDAVGDLALAHLLGATLATEAERRATLIGAATAHLQQAGVHTGHDALEALCRDAGHTLLPSPHAAAEQPPLAGGRPLPVQPAAMLQR